MAARSWIPPAAKPFLKRLGLDPETVADLGFGDVRKKIIEIAEAEETGLAPREKQAVIHCLEGESTAEVAKRLGLKAKSSAVAIEWSAAKKIRARMQRL